jgi:hypothetical protein
VLAGLMSCTAAASEVIARKVLIHFLFTCSARSQAVAVQVHRWIRAFSSVSLQLMIMLFC